MDEEHKRSKIRAGGSVRVNVKNKTKQKTKTKTNRWYTEGERRARQV